jgi:hypothetical protein
MERRQKMSVRDAMDLVDDNLPDGAYWAMVEEFAGIGPGEFAEELYEDRVKESEVKGLTCKICNKPFGSQQAKQQHVRAKGHYTKGTD